MMAANSRSNGSGAPVAKYKVVLLGEGAVGKTSIMLRYVENKFHAKHVSTLQASFLTKKLTVDNQQVELQLWDTAGQERFHALGPIYYRGSQGAVLVYDITDEDSFQRVKNWVKELRKILGDNVIIVIVGNKSDLERDRTVSKPDAQMFAQTVGATHVDASAKTSLGVEEMFVDLAKSMLSKHIKLPFRGSYDDEDEDSVPNSSRNVLQVVDSDDHSSFANGGSSIPRTAKKKCCS